MTYGEASARYGAEKLKPILFSAPMVRAVLDGRKTQTRRAIKPQPIKVFKENGVDVLIDDGTKNLKKRPFQIGGILWVRETWSDFFSGVHTGNPYIYKADEDRGSDTFRWKPSIFMPREAARLFLEVKSVRAERLQDISLDDCKAEGMAKIEDGEVFFEFMSLWDSLNAKRGCPWDSDPWVWVIEFEKLSGEA